MTFVSLCPTPVVKPYIIVILLYILYRILQLFLMAANSMKLLCLGSLVRALDSCVLGQSTAMRCSTRPAGQDCGYL